jgi:hypothetical protein
MIRSTSLSIPVTLRQDDSTPQRYHFQFMEEDFFDSPFLLQDSAPEHIMPTQILIGKPLPRNENENENENENDIDNKDAR